MAFATHLGEYFGSEEDVDKILNDDRLKKHECCEGYFICKDEYVNALEGEYGLDFITYEEMLNEIEGDDDEGFESLEEMLSLENNDDDDDDCISLF